MNTRTITLLKWIGIASVAIAILYAVLLILANRSLAKAYAALEADGRPMNAAQVIPIEIPDSDNDMAQAWSVLGLAARRADIVAVRNEYHELFIGLGRGELIPHGSWYLSGFLHEQPLARLRDDLRLQQAQIEAALALGATQRQAANTQLRRALTTGMTPIVDNTKTVGLIALPGAMTGMILAGASPLEAVQLQIIVMYMLVGAAAFSGLTATFLTYRQFFSRAHQLILPKLSDEASV